MPRMTHPDSQQAIEVEPGQVFQYQTQGWKTDKESAEDGRPAGNASLEAWQAYAASRGLDVEGKSRDDLRAELA